MIQKNLNINTLANSNFSDFCESLIDPWERVVQECLKRHKFLIVACSGGVDSMVLLNKLKDYRPEVLHLNYGLREEASLDEACVLNFAHEHGLKTHLVRVESAPEKGIQNWARTERYKKFKELQDQGACIVLGHHWDDWVETVLFRMLRGKSLGSLPGMMPYHKGLWRPLLLTPKKDIYEYAQSLGVPFREDSSNHSDKYSRNKLRIDLLPKLEGLVPGCSKHLIKLALDAADLARAHGVLSEDGVSSRDIKDLMKLGATRAKIELADWLYRSSGITPTQELFNQWFVLVQSPTPWNWSLTLPGGKCHLIAKKDLLVLRKD